METIVAFKQEDRAKESLIDIDKSQESVLVSSEALDISQHIRLLSAAGGDGSDTSNPTSPCIGERSQGVHKWKVAWPWRLIRRLGIGYESDTEISVMQRNHERHQGVLNVDACYYAVLSADAGAENNIEDPSKWMPIKESPCCIYKVPRMIRRVNEELYTPQLISIGPLHHGKPELVNMERKKEQYMESFGQRTSDEKINEIRSLIKKRENEIRASYTEVSPLESSEFVKMILYDSIFIIEIFLREYGRDGWDIVLDTLPVRYGLWTDLQLFENQLPYFILNEIYELAFNSDGNGNAVHTFIELTAHFFGKFMGDGLSSLTPELKVKHFTDWRRISLLKGHSSRSYGKRIDDLPCAVKLQGSGLKFESITTGQSVLDIKFEKSKHLFSFFEVNTLQIPQLQVSDETECLLRNIMALEQCLYPCDTQVCNYVALMDNLIDTPEDVGLLVENKIISNYMGDNASVATMFNKLNQNVAARPSCYHNICQQLKQHYNNPWNRARATLKRIYFNNPWKGTATVAAIILLFLTITQTVFAILAVV